MKVIVKKPKLQAEICEVEGISEINELVGNIDENGIGYDRVGTDIRMGIGKNVDIYVKEDCLGMAELGSNLWTPNDSAVWCGTVVFAGYDQEKKAESGVCSLTQDQIDYCLAFIAKQSI